MREDEERRRRADEVRRRGEEESRRRVEYITTRFTHGRVRYSVIFGGNPAQRLPQPVTLRIITEKIQKQMKIQITKRRTAQTYLYKTVFAEI